MLKKLIMEPCLWFRECGSCARFYSSLFYFNFYFILIYFIPSEMFSIVIPYSTLFVLYFNTFYCIIQSDAVDGIGFEAIYLFHLLHLLYLIQFSSLWFRVPIFLDLLRKTAGALPKFWFILVNSILFMSIEVYSSLFKPIQVYSKFRVWLRVRWVTGRCVTARLTS